MAGGTAVDFKIYDEQFQGGFWEGVQQSIDAFNGASNGAIVLRNMLHDGYFNKTAFDQLADAMRIRTLSSVADVSDTKMSQGELIGVKVNWANGPIAMTIDAFKKASRDPQQFSFVLGQQLGELVPQMQLNAACASLFGALTVTNAAYTAAKYNQSGLSGNAAYPTYQGLVNGMAKLGDRMNSVVAWLMDGTTYAKLMGDALANYVVDTVAGAVIAGGSIQTLGKPVIITDSSYLKTDAASLANDKSYIYGLVPNAVVVDVSEPPTSLVMPVLGKANIMYRFQAEGSFTVNIRGAAFATGVGHNPALSDLAADNWVQVASSVKGGPGVVIVTAGTFN
jgi:hypothetical protein